MKTHNTDIEDEMFSMDSDNGKYKQTRIAERNIYSTNKFDIAKFEKEYLAFINDLKDKKVKY